MDEGGLDALQNGEAVAELGVLGGELVQTELLLGVKRNKQKRRETYFARKSLGVSLKGGGAVLGELVELGFDVRKL